MAEDALFNLRWDAQRSALLGSVASLYREEAFVDTTIVADNKIYKAHKLLLSASSSYLKHILESVPSQQHAVLFMPHISSNDLGNVLKFIYDGEIKINRRSLKSFLTVAKLLRIKGMDFELDEDLEVNVPQSDAVTASTAPSVQSSSPSTSSQKRTAAESIARSNSEEDISAPPAKTSTMSSTSQMKHEIQERRLNSPREETHSFSNGAPNSNGNNVNEEPRISRPAPVSSSGRSTDSVSSQMSNPNNTGSPRESESAPPATVNGDDASHSVEKTRNDIEGVIEDSNESESFNDNRKALNLHIGRYHHDNESIDMDHESRLTIEDRDEHGIPIPDHDMDNDYDDDDEDDPHFSMSIQPEVSLRESDESFSIHDRRHHSLLLKPPNFTNGSFNGSFNLPILGSSSMSITATPGANHHGSTSSTPTSLSVQQQLTLKHLSKLSRPMHPKAHQMPGQGSPLAGQIPSLGEGILMRMMREPLQGASGKQISNSSSHGGFFDIPHGDPNLHPAGLRKQKRYVQCTSCSKVLSSLSALKRHMEDVHCARIQGKCLLCGRVYSSRNSLLTHVYSAHKKHHDYKAVARIIRESDFEQFATA